MNDVGKHHRRDVSFPSPLVDDPASARRCFHFAYVRGRHDREFSPTHTRDSEAAKQMQYALHSLGYPYGGTLYNYPYNPCSHSGPGGLMPSDLSQYGPQHLIYMTGRPGVHDRLDGVRDRVDPSHTALEHALLQAVSRHLSHCSRARICVADQHAWTFPRVAEFRQVQFRQKNGAAIDAVMNAKGRYERRPNTDRTTLVYLIYERHAWQNGPAFLCSFGLGAMETLVWNIKLARCYPHLLLNTNFAMAEMIAPKRRPERPESSAFAEDWQVTFLTDDLAGTR